MTSIEPPTERICERCGRKDIWDEDSETWVAATEGGTQRVGTAYCLHVWDISGSYNPIVE